METRLLLQDILKLNGIDPKDVLLIRHSLKHDNFRNCYENDYIHEYTQIQPGILKDLSSHKYWMVFISGKGTLARFYRMYEYKGKMSIAEHKFPENYPGVWDETDMFYQLDEIDLFKELENRLIIDWGKGVINWYYKGTNKKPVIAIHSQEKYQFKGYERSIFSFDELKNIVDDIGAGAYQEHQTALSSVKGVYLIVDTTDGKQYVGSAYNDKGILGRWSEYVKSHHGGNKELIRLLEQYPDRYKKFQFSILQIFSKGASDNEIIEAESLYKKKLCSIEFGLNDN